MGQMKVRTDDIVWQQLDDEVVVLDLRTSRYLRLNETSALLWKNLESGTSREELVQTLLAEFEIDETTAGRDVDAFLRDLEDQDLLL